MCDAGDAEPSSASRPRPLFSRRTLLIATGAAIGATAVVWDGISPRTSATAAGTYLRPCGDVTISSTWQDHKSRYPPSGEPGTDYAVGVGTPIRAAADGVIVDRKDSTTAATGRYLALRADDGNYIRYLHLRSSSVLPGTRVARGQIIAHSGASGFGSEAGYGPHVHVSLWIGGTPVQLGFANSVDFENYAQPEDPVPIHQSSEYSWNAVLPNRRWTTIPVGVGSYYLANTGTSRSETGDLTIYLSAIGVTRGLQVRVVAESLDLTGAVTKTSGQPVLEIPPSRDSAVNPQTFGQYALPYFLSGPLRLFAQVRALNAGIRLQKVIFKKNYWVS